MQLKKVFAFRMERALCDYSILHDCGFHSNTYLGNGVLLQKVGKTCYCY